MWILIWGGVRVGQARLSACAGYNSGGNHARSAVVTDVNGDRKPDLIVMNGTGVGVLLGNGDGTFKAAVNYNPGGAEAFSVAVADVNGDAKPDLIVANHIAASGGYIGVLIGNGDGTFQAALTYGLISQYPEDYSATSTAVSDVNGDGQPDIVFVAECVAWECNIDSKVVVLLGNGDGTFQGTLTYDSGGEGCC